MSIKKNFKKNPRSQKPGGRQSTNTSSSTGSMNGKKVVVTKYGNYFLLIPNTILFIFSIAMIAVGGSHWKDCKFDCPLVLVVMGSVALATSLVGILIVYINNNLLQSIDCLLGIALFSILIWGSVVVFDKFAYYDYEDTTSQYYCDKDTMLFAFALLIIGWILCPCGCCIGCCLITYDNNVIITNGSAKTYQSSNGQVVQTVECVDTNVTQGNNACNGQITKVVQTKDGQVVQTIDGQVVQTKDDQVVHTKDGQVVQTGDTTVLQTKNDQVVQTGDTTVFQTKDDQVVQTGDTTVFQTKDDQVVQTTGNITVLETKDVQVIKTKEVTIIQTKDGQVTIKRRAKSQTSQKDKRKKSKHLN